jgi:hypothetical protein
LPFEKKDNVEFMESFKMMGLTDFWGGRLLGGLNINLYGAALIDSNRFNL